MGRPFSRKDITLSFGLVTETVRLSQALDKTTEEPLKSLCIGQGDADHAATPITSVYQCPSCGPIIDRGTLKKGRESGNGWAVVDQEDIAALKKDTSDQFKKSIALTAHPVDQVLNKTQPTGKLYYLEPQNAGERFAIIRDLIAKHPQYAFVAQYTVSSRVSTYVARAEGEAIILEARAEVSLLAAPEVEGTANPAMYEMAEQLLGGMVTDFDADTYADTYTTKLAEMLDAADVVEGADTPEGSKVHKSSTDDDLLAGLAQQLAAVKQAS